MPPDISSDGIASGSSSKEFLERSPEMLLDSILVLVKKTDVGA